MIWYDPNDADLVSGSSETSVAEHMHQCDVCQHGWGCQDDACSMLGYVKMRTCPLCEID